MINACVLKANVEPTQGVLNFHYWQLVQNEALVRSGRFFIDPQPPPCLLLLALTGALVILYRSTWQPIFKIFTQLNTIVLHYSHSNTLQTMQLKFPENVTIDPVEVIWSKCWGNLWGRMSENLQKLANKGCRSSLWI